MTYPQQSTLSLHHLHPDPYSIPCSPTRTTHVADSIRPSNPRSPSTPGAFHTPTDLLVSTAPHPPCPIPTANAPEPNFSRGATPRKREQRARNRREKVPPRNDSMSAYHKTMPQGSSVTAADMSGRRVLRATSGVEKCTK